MMCTQRAWLKGPSRGPGAETTAWVAAQHGAPIVHLDDRPDCRLCLTRVVAIGEALQKLQDGINDIDLGYSVLTKRLRSVTFLNTAWKNS
jgi:hypothetical protein